MYDSTLRVIALLLNLVLGHLQLTSQSAVRWSGILGKALSIYGQLHNRYRCMFVVLRLLGCGVVYIVTLSDFAVVIPDLVSYVCLVSSIHVCHSR